MTGAQLKALRYKLGLSLAKASKQVEVSPRTWCRWESDETPVPERAVKLFFLLNKITTEPVRVFNPKKFQRIDKAVKVKA